MRHRSLSTRVPSEGRGEEEGEAGGAAEMEIAAGEAGGGEAEERDTPAGETRGWGGADGRDEEMTGADSGRETTGRGDEGEGEASPRGGMEERAEGERGRWEGEEPRAVSETGTGESGAKYGSRAEAAEAGRIGLVLTSSKVWVMEARGTTEEKERGGWATGSEAQKLGGSSEEQNTEDDGGSGEAG